MLDDTIYVIGKMYVESLDKPADPLTAALLDQSMQNYSSIKNIEREFLNIKVGKNLFVAAT